MSLSPSELNIYETLSKGLPELSLFEAEHWISFHHATIIDTRNTDQFLKTHIPNSLHLPKNQEFMGIIKNFCSDLGQPLILIADNNLVEDTLMVLAKLGYDKWAGFLSCAAFQSNLPICKMNEFKFNTISELQLHSTDKEVAKILDIRTIEEYEGGHFENAVNLPLHRLNEINGILPKSQYLAVFGPSKSHTAMALSVLKRLGFRQIVGLSNEF